MRYTRRFRISACHFNDQETYDAYERIFMGLALDERVPAEDVKRCIHDVHGHNFEITISVDNGVYAEDEENPEPWIVDDLILEKLVNQWDKTNLSVHADFQGKRATTENMVRALLSKLSELDYEVQWRVRVQETPDVYAEGEWNV